MVSINEYSLVRDQEHLRKLFPRVQAVIGQALGTGQVNKFQRFSAFRFGRMPPKNNSKQAVDALVDIWRKGHFRPGGDCPRLFHNKRRVEGKECLLGHGGMRPPLDTLVWDGKIKGAKERRQVLPVHKTVKSATAIQGISGEIHWPATNCDIEPA